MRNRSLSSTAVASISRPCSSGSNRLNSGIATLGQPHAALLAFGVAILAYNVLAVLQTAITAQHKLEPFGGIDLSAYYLAVEIRAHYAGMMVPVALTAWQAYDAMTPRQLARTLRKHARGPKVAKTKARCPPAKHENMLPRHVYFRLDGSF
jgi:hypothetical protein